MCADRRISSSPFSVAVGGALGVGPARFHLTVECRQDNGIAVLGVLKRTRRQVRKRARHAHRVDVDRRDAFHGFDSEIDALGRRLVREGVCDLLRK